MPLHAFQVEQSKTRLLSSWLATLLVCSSFTESQGQTSIQIDAPPNYVFGLGLSPSYYLPPSAESLTENSSLKVPIPTAPSLIGSGLTADPITPVPTVDGPSQNPQVQLNPSDIPHPSLPRVSVEVDLRSLHPNGVAGSLDSPSTRPLSAPSPWFFHSNALILKLKQQEDQVFSSDAIDPSIRLLGTKDVSMPNTGGYELAVGRYFGCGKYALSASYWGLSPVESLASSSILPIGGLSTNLPFNVDSPATPSVSQGLYIGAIPLRELFNSAPVHQLVRQREFNNLELNLYWFAIGGAARQPLAPNCNDGQCWSLSDLPTATNAPWFQTPSRFRLSLFSGVRWFQYQDELRYSAVDAYYRSNVRNDLWGAQSGATTHLLLSPRWTVWSRLAAGLYNNRAELDTASGDSSSLATIVSSGPANGTTYNYDASSNQLSFLGETTTGLAWHFARGWTANFGYRILGASGIASAQGQIPMDFRAPEQASAIRSSDSMILHGVTIGANYNF